VKYGGEGRTLLNHMLTFLALPSASTILTDTASSSQTLFSEFLPLALFGVGFLIGGIIVVAIISWLVGGIGILVNDRENYKEWKSEHH